MKYKGTQIIAYYVNLAKKGTIKTVDIIMTDLNPKMTIAESKFIDYALGHVTSKEGFKRMEHYLFKGTIIQRNYCALYFSRKEEWPIVKKAYEMGFIDGRQAFSR
jgi:hypothetical protein